MAQEHIDRIPTQRWAFRCLFGAFCVFRVVLCVLEKNQVGGLRRQWTDNVHGRAPRLRS